jgi:hypothetical protein
MRRLTMPDLCDGESVEMKGFGSRPYVLKNVGGIREVRRKTYGAIATAYPWLAEE